jgi:hypothetical protein
MSIEYERDERGHHKVPYPGQRLMWWKCIYDTKTPTWRAYGRVAFVEGATEIEANRAALVAAQTEYPGAEILPHAIGVSTLEAAAAFFEKRRRLAEWQKNTSTGVPNTRQTLNPKSHDRADRVVPEGGTPEETTETRTGETTSTPSPQHASPNGKA